MNPEHISEQPQNPEQLAQQQLAANLAHLAEQQETEQVAEYLNDLLADTEHKAPEERAAAFEFLAQEQTAQIRETTMTVASQTVVGMAESTERHANAITDNANRTRQVVSRLDNDHRHEVGRHIRQFNPRAVLQAHEGVVEAVNRGYTTAARSSRERLHEWRADQNRQTEHFGAVFTNGMRHEQAIREAAKVVDPSHQGEQKDISPIIEESVKQMAAEKVMKAVSEAATNGVTPEQAVLSLLEITPDMVSDKTIQAVAGAIHQQQDMVNGATRRAEGAVEDSEYIMKQFATKGRDVYSYMRSPQDAEEAFRAQSQRLRRGLEDAEVASRMTVKSVQDARQQLQAIQQFVDSKRQAEQSSAQGA